ncbi:MAG: hypothetical protein ACT6Q7_02845 [Blastomonas fulva]|uniref:hypothetical protein n=1 Tax=Blastomonas fulva TaxID=1550728 RepID=UPI0040341FFE
MSNAANGLRLSARQQASGLSADVLAIAIAGMAPSDLLAAMSDEQKAAVTPAPAAASDEEASDKAMKPKKNKKGSEDGDEDEGDKPMASVITDTKPLASSSEIGQAFMQIFPSASASQILACISVTDRAKAATPAPAPAKEPSEEDLGAAALASAIRHNNASLGAGGEPAANTDSSALWDKAIKANNPHLNR